jgi:hypothetical protein
MTKAVKGFNKDMTCREFQYQEGKEYETESASLCNEGFHACLNPLDCFRYYSPGGGSVYHEVEIDDNGERGGDSKIVGSKIKIGAELDVAKICKLHFEFVKNQTIQKKNGENVSSLAAQDNSSLAAQDYSSLAAQDWSSLAAGKNSVLACFNGRCRAGRNSLIAIANRKWNGNDYEVTDFKAGIVDGKKIKADTWYKLVNGEFVEVNDDEN